MKQWCINPYYSKAQYIDDIDIPCSVIHYGGEFSRKQIQDEFDKGIKPKRCEVCWQDEESGNISRRQSDNKWISEKSGWDLETLYDNRHSPRLLQLQYKSSNLCNLACKTCYSGDSTRWYAEDRHYGRYLEYKDTPITITDTQLISDSDLFHLASLDILGGEPFIDNSFHRLLQRLVDLGNTDCHLDFTTNGQQMPNKKLYDLLQKFPNVHIQLSIDGFEKTYEYMRYPGKWDKLTSVTNALKKTNWDISCYITISNLNVYYFDTIVEWALGQFSITGVRYQFVDKPNEFQVHVMPEGLKHVITKKFLNNRMDDFFLPVVKRLGNLCDINDIKKLKDTVSKQDSYRKIDPKDFVPEIIDYLY